MRQLRNSTGRKRKQEQDKATEKSFHEQHSTDWTKIRIQLK
jgi:hypothetical protein